jgi:DNA-binding transcriptional ArsR family regulator
MAASGDDGRRRDRTKRYRHAALFHPLRRAILNMLLEGREAGADEIANELDEAPRRIAHHLRVLGRRGALKATARGPATPALYRWSPQAHWARKMLGKSDEQG